MNANRRGSGGRRKWWAAGAVVGALLVGVVVNNGANQPAPVSGANGIREVEEAAGATEAATGVDDGRPTTEEMRELAPLAEGDRHLGPEPTDPLRTELDSRSSDQFHFEDDPELILGAVVECSLGSGTVVEMPADFATAPITSDDYCRIWVHTADVTQSDIEYTGGVATTPDASPDGPHVLVDRDGSRTAVNSDQSSVASAYVEAASTPG